MKNDHQESITAMPTTLLVIFLVVVSACKTTQPGYIRDTKGNLIPNLAVCARQNFPEMAKDFIEEAQVATRVTADKRGVIISVEPLKVIFPPHLDKKTADMLTPTFKSSAVLSLRGQECPVLIVGNEPQPYSMDFLLDYRVVPRTYTSVDGSPIEPSGDMQPWR